MLNYAVLDTNGDGRIDASDTRVSAIAFGTGIINLVAMFAGNSGDPDKILLTSSNGDLLPGSMAGAVGNVYQRIMWRQIQ
jgi:type IV pilus assembly protein PilY1